MVPTRARERCDLSVTSHVTFCVHPPVRWHRRGFSTSARPQAGPRPPRCHPPLSPTPSIPYPTPMPTHTRPVAIVLPRRQGNLDASRVQQPLQPNAAGCGCRACPACFIHPHRGPFSLSGGCSEVVSLGTRLVAAPRSSSPRSRLNPQAAPSPVAPQPGSTAKLHRAPATRSQARRGREKARGTKRIESNRPSLHPGKGSRWGVGEEGKG